jgi:hypothetical protein
VYLSLLGVCYTCRFGIVDIVGVVVSKCCMSLAKVFYLLTRCAMLVCSVPPCPQRSDDDSDDSDDSSDDDSDDSDDDDDEPKKKSGKSKPSATALRLRRLTSVAPAA